MSHASFVHKFISSQKHSVIQSKWFIRYWKWAGQEDTRKFHFYVVHTPRTSTPITILHSFKWLMVFWENFLGVSKYFEFSSVVVSRQNVFYGVLTIFKSDPKLWRREIYWIEPRDYTSAILPVDQVPHLPVDITCGSSSTLIHWQQLKVSAGILEEDWKTDNKDPTVNLCGSTSGPQSGPKTWKYLYLLQVLKKKKII